MMVSRDGLFGILIGATVGTLSFVPAHGSAQGPLSIPCAAVEVLSSSPLEDLTRCAEQGDAEAQHVLGLRYATGVGVDQDDEEAVGWYLSAAEQGYLEAQYNLGIMYGTGRGVIQDDAEAVRRYRLAAEEGHAVAQLNLGAMYGNGEGVPEDDAEAARWYRLAAEQGNAIAQANLGLKYANGDGVPKDLVLAYVWYNLAAAQGDEFAGHSKQIIERRMTREQIDEAERLSREWIEVHPQDGGN
jgi:TPR repeat protein